MAEMQDGRNGPESQPGAEGSLVVHRKQQTTEAPGAAECREKNEAEPKCLGLLSLALLNTQTKSSLGSKGSI